MTDIVERLRKGVLIAVEETPAMTVIMPDGEELKCGPSRVETRQLPHPDASEAADTIEALRKRLEVVDGWSESVDGISCRDDTIKLQDAEIEALRSEVTDLQNAIIRLTRELSEARDAGAAEIVAWLRTYPPVIGLDEMTAWNVSCFVERHEHRKD